jgi:hypothetical protein
MDEYRKWNAVSHSRLSLAAKSPAHYRYGRAIDPNRTLRLSSLVHCGVLDPLAIAKRYCFMPDFAQMPENINSQGERSYSSSTSYVRTMQERFRQLHPNRQLLSEAEYERMVGIARSLHENDLVLDLLRVGRPEVSIVWDDKPTGLRCKMRTDWLRIECGLPDAIVVDLVTTQDATRFEHAIATYGYHRRMAFQLRGLLATGFASDIQPWIIAVETHAPFACRVARLCDDAIATGHYEVDDLFKVVACSKANACWPAYENPAHWDVPADYAGLPLHHGGHASRRRSIAAN